MYGYSRYNGYRPYYPPRYVYPRYGQALASKTFGQNRYGKKSRSTWQKKARQCLKDTNRNIVHVVRGPTPTQAYVKLKVAGGFRVVFAGVDYNTTGLLANFLNPTSPNATFVTQQATGYDQWAAMFQHFTVLGSKIKVVANNVGQINGQTSDRSFSFTVIPSSMTETQIQQAADGGALSNQGLACDLINDAKATTRYLGQNQSGASQVIIGKYIASKTLFPDKDVRNDALFTGDTNAYTSGEQGPAQYAAWYYYIQSTQHNTPNTDDDWIDLRIEVTYYTLFSSPVNVFDN